MKKVILMTLIVMHPLIQAFLGDYVYAESMFVQGYYNNSGNYVDSYSRQAPQQNNYQQLSNTMYPSNERLPNDYKPAGAPANNQWDGRYSFPSD